jgi:hypothetical protein
MAHLRRLTEPIIVFDDVLGQDRIADSDDDLLQRGLSRVDGDVVDCCRRRDFARDGVMLVGDVRRGNRVTSRFARLERLRTAGAQ